jgi:hypothetical protein
MEFMTLVAVLTNAGVSCFTSKGFVGGFNATQKLLAFVAFEHLVFSAKLCIMFVMPDEPEEVRIQVQRMDWLCRKLISKEPDDEEVDISDARTNAVDLRPRSTYRG